MDNDEILQECTVCHLDALAELMENGVCEDCLARFATEDKYCTQFEKAHGNEFDWSDDNG